MAFPAHVLSLDVSGAIGERASLAATYYPARAGDGAAAILVCLPGGTYSREYWDLGFPATTGTASPNSPPATATRS